MLTYLGQLLSNFLGGLEVARIRPKRFLLQTGAKHYGVHLGPAKTPQRESDLRVALEPNFYYNQEDILFEYSKKTSVPWNVVRPAAIIGTVKTAAMNIVWPLTVYATVQRYLGGNLNFPGDWLAWEKEQTQSSARLNSYLSEWAALNPETANQAFNAADSCPFTWGTLWQELANWYGLECIPPNENANYKELPLTNDRPPRGWVKAFQCSCMDAHSSQLRPARSHQIYLHFDRMGSESRGARSMEILNRAI